MTLTRTFLVVFVFVLLLILPVNADSNYFYREDSGFYDMNVTSVNFGNLYPPPNGSYVGISESSYHTSYLGSNVTIRFNTLHNYYDKSYMSLDGCSGAKGPTISYGTKTNYNYTIPTSGCTNSSHATLYYINAGYGSSAVLGYSGKISFGSSPSIVASWTVSPVSGSQTGTAMVQFTDTSSGTPTSWIWDYGDGRFDNSTSQNPYHYYNASGSYSVKMKATNAYSSSWSNSTYVINSYSAPSCNFSVTNSTYSGTSPLHVYLSDTSTNIPTSYYWDFNNENVGWLSVSPSQYNTTSNPDVIITGSGYLNVLHYVSNPAGTSYCPITIFNITGPVPSPTPTPPIPFPNQTGVCQGSSITLGSGVTTLFPRYLELTEPDGNNVAWYYDTDSAVYTSGTDYTQQLGQYYYAEYNLSKQMLYQSSYIVENCYPTPTSTVTYTVIPTKTYHIIPTQTPNVMTTTISITTNISSVFPDPIQTFATIPPYRNTSGDLNVTQLREELTEISPLFTLYLDFVDFIMYPVYDIVVDSLSVLLNMLSFDGSVTWVINSFTVLLESFSSLMFLTTLALQQVMSAIPIKVQNTITFLFFLDIIKQVYNLKRGDRL